MPIPQIVGAGLDGCVFGLRDRDRLSYLGDGDERDGGSGDGLLNSGAGPGSILSGAGNEICRVDKPGNFISDELFPGGDAVGMNYVVGGIGFGLGFYLEKLGLTGTAGPRRASDDLGNTIKDNSGSKVVSGGDATDIICDFGGDDVLLGGNRQCCLCGRLGADTAVLRPELGFRCDRTYDSESVERIGFYVDEFGQPVAAVFRELKDCAVSTPVHGDGEAAIRSRWLS